MKALSKRLYTFSCSFIQGFSFILTALLFLGSFLITCYCVDFGSQKVLMRWDHPLFGVIGVVLFLCLTALLTGLLSYMYSHAAKFPNPVTLLTVLVLVWSLSVGAVLIVFGKTGPTADAFSVYQAAAEFANGNTHAIHPTDSYFSYYPHQMGLVAFFELMHRFYQLFSVNLPAYHFFKCFYVVLACAIILFQRGIVRLLWADERAECIYLLLAGANLPFLMYTSFVYGEIPSFAAFSGGLYFLLKLFSTETTVRRPQVLYGFAALILLTLSVMLRKNNLILIIAVLIVILFQWLRDKKVLLLIFALCCALCCFSILPLVQKSYELRAGNRLSSGVPAISYFAMGMQESSVGNGWYNGFNFYTYQDTDLDTEATAQLSRQIIRERLNYFKEHPGYAINFYLLKHLSQWADGTYASRQSTASTFGGRSSFFKSLYEGEYSVLFINYSNIYQNVLYLGAFLFCAFHLLRPRKQYLPEYLGMIGVTGGFLFHIIWEANSRYIFPYSLLLMPYCARGLSLLFERLNNKFHRSRAS